MTPAKAKWRDWDWDGDPYTPGRLSTPGRLIFCVGDLWEESASIHAADTVTDVFAAALLNQSQTFILCTDNPVRAERFLRDDLFAPNVQRRAAQVMETLAGVPERPEFPVRPINPKTQQPYTAAECAAWAEFYGDPWEHACAGLGIPQGQLLLPNVWIGARMRGRSPSEHAQAFAALGSIPAAVRFLFLSGGCECAFEGFVWGERHEPIPSKGEYIDTRAVPFRRIDWVICGGINVAAAEYHAAQAIETGTPYWMEQASYLPLDLSVQLWPAQAEREPHLLPEAAAELRRQEFREKGGNR